MVEGNPPPSPEPAGVSAEAGLLEFLRSLSRLIRLFKLYPPEHQFVKQGVEEALGLYERSVQDSPGVTFGQAEGTLLIGDRTFSKVPAQVADLLAMLREQSVDSVELKAGVGSEEILGFARLLALRPGGEVPADLKIRSFSELPHIQVNGVTYRRVAASQEVVRKGSRPAGGGDESLLVEALLHDTSGDTIEEALLENLLDLNPSGLGRAIHQASAQAADEAPGSRGMAIRMLERAARKVLKAGGGRPEVRAKLAEVLENLPAEFLRTLGGDEDPENAPDGLMKRFGAGFRGRLLARELRQELAFSDLEKEVARLLGAGEDPRFLFEEASRTLAKDNLPLREAGPYLLDLVEMLRRRRREEVRTVAEPAASASSKYRIQEKPLAVLGVPANEQLFQELLEEQKYQVSVCASGEAVLEAARKDSPALVVLDLRIPGLHASDILRNLRRENLTPAFLLITDHWGLTEDLDVKAYPRQVCLKKPPNRDAILKAVQDLAKGKGAPKEEEEAPEPERGFTPGLARLLESSGLRELPAVPSFEVGCDTRFDAGSEAAVIDGFTLGTDRPGILLASRSGADAEGVALLRLFHAAVRVAAPWVSSGKSAVVQAAGFLGTDPIREAPIAAQTLILDPLGGEIRVCTAGAPFPLRYLAASKKVRKVGSVGVAVGGLMRGGLGRVIEEERILLDPGDLLLFTSWGILKSVNAKGEPFGVESLGGLLITASTSVPSSVAQRILQGVSRHAAGKPVGAAAVIALRRAPAAPAAEGKRP